jgi:non-ribosomal peptide synthetase component F
LNGRVRPELAETIGHLQNTAVIRTLVDPNRTFGELVRTTAAQLDDALRQEAPFE